MSADYIVTIEQTLREILGLTDEEIKELMEAFYE